mmetsp:Transcript_5802/g.13802  ORF Transcript_5802/g.13802 Transcript_5802/m.13802 type:complete len:242 (+) Transcript_5802:133-858(+)
MLLPSLPLSFIGPPIWPYQSAFSVLLCICEASFISLAVQPLHNANWAHLVPFPLACVDFAITPPVRASSMHVIALKLTVVVASCLTWPSELALAMLFAFKEFALVEGAISPFLYSFTMWLLLLPLASVCRTIAVVVCPMPMFMIVVKLAIVAGAIRKYQLPLTMFLLTLPLPFISGSTLQLCFLAGQRKRIFAVPRQIFGCIVFRSLIFNSSSNNGCRHNRCSSTFASVRASCVAHLADKH